MNFKYTLAAVLTAWLLLLNCTNRNKLILLETTSQVDLKVRSSCKSSAFSPLEKEQELKQTLLQQQAKSLKKFKIKQSTSEKKANYKIRRTQFIITERCGAKTNNNKPFVGFHQILTLENLRTSDTLTITVDTIYVSQNSISSPSSIVQKKVDPEPYVISLTDKAIKSLKLNFK